MELNFLLRIAMVIMTMYVMKYVCIKRTCAGGFLKRILNNLT